MLIAFTIPLIANGLLRVPLIKFDENSTDKTVLISNLNMISLPELPRRESQSP